MLDILPLIFSSLALLISFKTLMYNLKMQNPQISMSVISNGLDTYEAIYTILTNDASNVANVYVDKNFNIDYLEDLGTKEVGTKIVECHSIIPGKCEFQLVQLTNSFLVESVTGHKHYVIYDYIGTGRGIAFIKHTGKTWKSVKKKREKTLKNHTLSKGLYQGQNNL